MVQRPKSASPPLDGRRNCRPTFSSLSAHLVYPGCRGEFNQCRFSSKDELRKIDNWFFLPFSGRSRPSCPDGETGRVLENLDLRRGILHILQYKHLNVRYWKTWTCKDVKSKQIYNLHLESWTKMLDEGSYIKCTKKYNILRERLFPNIWI